MRYVSITAALLLMLVVHLDWHLARSHHHRFSLEWHEHWILGLVTFAALVLFAARKWPGHFVRGAFWTGLSGLFLGQVVEPVFEVLGYGTSAMALLSFERWRIFFEFSFAGVGGTAIGVALVYAFPRLSGGTKPDAGKQRRTRE